MIAPDDERHGSTRGFHAGCRNTCCRRAIARDEKHRRLDKLSGGRAIPAIGAQRRIRALMALGWSSEQIAHEAGLPHRNRVLRVVNGQKGKPTTWVERATHEWVCAVYDKLSMRLATGVYADRTRTYAAKMGWAAPLCWDDIDDPDETPAGRYDKPAWRGDLIREYVDRGDNLTWACRQLSINLNALQVWCSKNDMRAEYRALASREGDWNSRGRIAHDGAA